VDAVLSELFTVVVVRNVVRRLSIGLIVNRQSKDIKTRDTRLARSRRDPIRGSGGMRVDATVGDACCVRLVPRRVTNV
jgi:hypothetical protein